MYVYAYFIALMVIAMGESALFICTHTQVHVVSFHIHVQHSCIFKLMAVDVLLGLSQ